MKKENKTERRQHKRYFPKLRAFVLVDPKDGKLNRIKKMSKGQIGAAVFQSKPAKMGRILEISRSGLSFTYIANSSDIITNQQLDILLADEKFLLPKLKFKPVNTSEHKAETPFNPLAIKRQSVRFVGLTTDQKSKLDYFLRKYTNDTQNTKGKQAQGNG